MQETEDIFITEMRDDKGECFHNVWDSFFLSICERCEYFFNVRMKQTELNLTHMGQVHLEYVKLSNIPVCNLFLRIFDNCCNVLILLACT